MNAHLHDAKPAATKGSRVDSRRGFTLLELMVVVVILAAVAAIVMPRLPNSARAERSEALRRMAVSVQTVYEHATVKKKV